MLNLAQTIASLIIFIILQISFCFEVPEVILQAFKPKGFKITLPEISGINLFVFHGNLNNKINIYEPGDITYEITYPEKDGWTHFDPNLTLAEGDVINYWLLVQHQQLRYKKPPQQWKVKDLLPMSEANSSCPISSTKLSGRNNICQGTLLYEDNFSDLKAWVKEQYIPIYTGPDFEFCSYENNNDIYYNSIKDSSLFIKPKIAQDDSEVRGTLDLMNGCTSSNPKECKYTQKSIYLLPPVKSAKLRLSDFRFTFGKIEINAKLPKGDWMYPEIYVASVSNPQKKILIAYARGNEELTGSDGDDIGGKLLFGGPVLNSIEPNRSKRLSSIKSATHLGNMFHTYSLLWSPQKITLFLDGIQYGEIPYHFAVASELYLGVGIGGVNDFPDDYISGNFKKPWKNNNKMQVKDFFDARNEWFSTWNGDSSALQVKSIKIWAL